MGASEAARQTHAAAVMDRNEDIDCSFRLIRRTPQFSRRGRPVRLDRSENPNGGPVGCKGSFG
jgi:hypothetical protein